MKRYFSGRKLFIARVQKGFTVEQLAEKVEITPGHLEIIEQERAKPSIRLIVLLANALEVDVDLFFE